MFYLQFIIVLVLGMLFVGTFLYYAESFLIYLLTGAKAVRTPRKDFKALLGVLNLKPGEKFYELGFGDGDLLLEILKKTKANVKGFERSFFKYFFVKARLKLQGLEKGLVCRKNFLKENLAQGQVFYCYLSPRQMRRLEPKILAALKNGGRVISALYKFPNLKFEEIYEIGPLYAPRKYYFYRFNKKS